MTAPATPTVTVTALDDLEALLGAALNYVPGGAGYCRDPFATRADSALAVTRALVEAALAWRDIDPLRLETIVPAANRLCSAIDTYRNWHPAPATVTSGDSGGSGE